MERVNTFKYLGATLAENGDLDAEMTHRIQSGWKNWKRISGILCDRRISLRVKGKVYKTVVRPAMMYGAETWAMKKAHEKKLDVAEMRMLRWMSGVTKLDRIRNERIRGTTKVGEISKKVQESRLKWYGHVSRREDEYVGKRVMGMEVPGKRRRGRPKRRWLDSIRNDLSERELSALFFFLCYLDKIVGNVINDSVYHALGLSLSLSLFSLFPLSGVGCCPQLLHRLIW